MNRNRALLFLVIGITFLGLGGWFFTHRGTTEQITYKTVPVEKRDLRLTVSATAVVQPLTTVDIKSRAGGEVKKLAVEVGDVIKPGQLIAMIDPTDSLTAFNQAQADVQAAQAKISQTKQTLSLQGATTTTSIAEATAQVNSARAKLQQAIAQANAQPALTEAAIRQARASLQNAEQQYQQMTSGTDPQTRADARTALDSAQANLKNAEANLRRQQQLAASGFVAQSTVDNALAQRDVALANAEAARTRAATIGSGQAAAIAAARAHVNEAREALRSAESQRVQIALRRQDVASARAALAQAQATLATARANSAQIGIRAADIDQARSQIARAEAQQKSAQVQLDSTTIRAPRAGVILQKYVEQGTIITSGQSFNSSGTSIVQIGDLSRVFVEAAVDEADIANIKVGQKVKVTLDAYPDDEFVGKVNRIDPRGTTDQNVTTIKTEVEILHPDGRLRPGLNAECEFVISERKDTLVVPARAVKGKGGDKTIQILSANKTPETRKVKVGLETNDAVEISEGLQEGDLVITGVIQPGDNGGKGGKDGKGGQNGGPGGLGGQGGGPGGRDRRGPGGL